MGEHDDDLESKVYEGGENEVNSYPNTGDELDGLEPDAPDDEDDEPALDEDPAEL